MCKAGPCPRCQSPIIKEVPYTRDWSYPQCWRCLYSNYRNSANSECDSWTSFEGNSNQSTEMTPEVKIRIHLFDSLVIAGELTKGSSFSYYDYKTVDKLVRKLFAKLQLKFSV